MKSKIFKIIKNQFFVDEDYFYPGAAYLYFFDNNYANLVLSARSKNNFSYLLNLEIDLRRMIGTPSAPIIKLGPKDSFDEHGISYPCIFNFQDQTYLFYTGWSLNTTNPFLNTLGYARLEDSVSKLGSLIVNNDKELIKEIGSVDIKRFNNFNYMFFTKFNEWEDSNPKYSIRAAKSSNIHSWQLDPTFNFEDLDELSSMVCRPSLVLFKSQYLLFFSHRETNSDYKIGLAKSSNFFEWKVESTNIFENFILEDWCKDGQAYPHVSYDFKTNSFYLFFAGNSYGRDGFGMINFIPDEIGL